MARVRWMVMGAGADGGGLALMVGADGLRMIAAKMSAPRVSSVCRVVIGFSCWVGLLLVDN
jgi:hypothetical protein